MLISLSTHLLLLMFELLVADNLETQRHLWILVIFYFYLQLTFLISPIACRKFNETWIIIIWRFCSTKTPKSVRPLLYSLFQIWLLLTSQLNNCQSLLDCPNQSFTCHSFRSSFLWYSSASFPSPFPSGVWGTIDPSSSSCSAQSTFCSSSFWR
jgi:hypothetical protein